MIDGALPESVRQIVANIRSLGFRIEDVKVILNSHVHFDHAGGIAELQRLSGARVIASKWSAAVMKKGGVGRGDPQFGVLAPITAVKNVHELSDGENVARRHNRDHGTSDSRAHAGRDELDMEILRRHSLPRHGLCGQPDSCVGVGISIYTQP